METPNNERGLEALVSEMGVGGTSVAAEPERGDDDVMLTTTSQLC